MKISPFLEYHLQNHETCLNCDQARAQLSSKSNSKLMNYKNGKTKSIHTTLYSNSAQCSHNNSYRCRIDIIPNIFTD